jgi:hypothetical protein
LRGRRDDDDDDDDDDKAKRFLANVQSHCNGGAAMSWSR